MDPGLRAVRRAEGTRLEGRGHRSIESGPHAWFAGPVRNMKTRRVAIVGASGYSGEELVRLLLGHPGVELVAVTSRQYAGQTLAQVFPRFAHLARARELLFQEPDVTRLAAEAEVVFLALPHGVAAEFARPLLEAGRVVIDLSADFRLRDPAVYDELEAKSERLARGLADHGRVTRFPGRYMACRSFTGRPFGRPV